jgi:L-ascorbate metabolism protein UlaG (beta-lactamase superfamily)
MSAIAINASCAGVARTLTYALAVPLDERSEIRWLGHASSLIDLDGVRFLTDPALTPRLAHLRRHHTVEREAIADVDVVLISHVHMDHLHLPSLRLLGPVRLVVPAGVGRWLRKRGFSDVIESRVGDRRDFGPVTVETVSATHSPGRGPHSRIHAPAVGYVLRSAQGSVYFAGDTDLFDGMAELGAIDVALLPIAGWGASLGAGHLDPRRAATATGLILPRLVVPIHWGTYSPMSIRAGQPDWLHRPAEQFASAIADAGHDERLRLLRPGQRLVLPGVDTRRP